MKASARERNGTVSGGRAATLTLADQCLSSGSNVAMGVLIARAGGAEALGAFGIAFLLWLAILAGNRALVSEPMTVTGPTDGGDMQLREGAYTSLALGLACAAALTVAGGVLLLLRVDSVAVLALAPWVPSLVLQDYWRGMSFRLLRADRALISDTVFVVVQAAVTLGALALSVTSPAAFIGAWGVGATAGAVVGSLLAGVTLVPRRGGWSHLRMLWPRSRWFLGEAGTAFLSDQGYLLLLPILLGTAEFGVFRAGASLVGPAVVLFLAAGNIGLPGCVRVLRDGGLPGLSRFTRLLGLAVVGLTTGYCVLIALVAEPALRLMYGEDFTEAAVITRLVALQYVLYALGVACGVAVKALGQMRRLWAMRAVSAVVSLSSMVLLAGTLGLTGAGLASVVAGGSLTAGVLIVYRRVMRGSPVLGQRGVGVPPGPDRVGESDL